MFCHGSCCARLTLSTWAQIRAGEMQVQKAQNMIEHKDEILSRPKRTWFQSNLERQEAKGELYLNPDADHISKAVS